MKRLSFFTSLFFAILLLSAGLTSCSKDDNSNNSNNSNVTGNWRISLYYDNTDETARYNGYTLSFNSGGVLVASNGTNTVNGTWSVTSSKFIINFGTDPLFSDLNDDWQIVENTSTSIKLKDDNPAQDDKLEMIKL